MEKVDNVVNRKIKYYLYIYRDIDKMIKEIETDIIDSSNVTLSNWLKGKHCFTNTIENQAIALASSKQLKELKMWKEKLNKILGYIKQYYPKYYKFVELKYFKKLKCDEIKQLLKTDINTQSQIDKNIISLIALCVNGANFFNTCIVARKEIGKRCD